MSDDIEAWVECSSEHAYNGWFDTNEVLRVGDVMAIDGRAAMVCRLAPTQEHTRVFFRWQP